MVLYRGLAAERERKMTDNLRIKVDKAIKLLRSTCRDREVELSYSGGKDSDVILELAKMAGINYRAIYKNTTIDPPGTIRHVRENNVEIVRPKETFLQLIERKGFPTRRARFCCQVLKEYKIMDIAIQGIRRSESSKRAKLYKEPTLCRIYNNNKANHVEVILPILDWTDNDVVGLLQSVALNYILSIILKERLMSKEDLGAWVALYLRTEDLKNLKGIRIW